MLVLIGTSCKPKGWSVPNPTEQEAVEEELRAFEQSWLRPARIAPPNVDFEARSAQAGPVTVTVRPLRPEDAEWNQWPGDTLRLFNNRAALLFEVTIESEGRVRWAPEATALELNDPGNRVPPARTPDELLVPLLRAALLQERWAVDGDYVQRTRAAGPFRAAYLSVDAAQAPLGGVVAFPLPEPELHVIALQVTVGVHTPKGLQAVPFLYE